MERRNLTCADCGQSFDAKPFGRLPTRCEGCATVAKRTNSARRSAAFRTRHPEKVREYDRLWKAADRQRPGYSDRRRAGWLRTKFGLTPEEYDALLAGQGGKCAICRGNRNGPGSFFHIDHCHDSGRIRGLLCAKCNTAVGLLDNDPARAEAVAKYLRT